MSDSKTSAADPLQHIATLRAALQRSVSELAFAAGREAAADPEYSGRLLAVADEMADVLSRTAP